MDVTVEDISNVEKNIQIQFPADLIQDKIDKKLNDLKGQVVIKGFRPGKAPVKMLKKLFGKQVEDEIVEDLIKEELPKLLEEKDFQPVKVPEITERKFNQDQSYSLQVGVEIQPIFEPTDYLGVEVTEKTVEIDDEAVQSELKKIQEANAVLKPVEDRDELQDGDTAIIDFVAEIEGEPMPGGKSENFQLEIGSKSFVGGLEEKIIGMKIEENREVEIYFQNDHPHKLLAGKTALFKVDLKEIKLKELPELNDELAKTVGEYETLEQLREKITAGITEMEQEKIKDEQKQEVLKQILIANDIELPPSMVERYNKFLESQHQQQQQMLKSIAAAQGENSASPAPEVDEETLKETWQKKAKEQVKEFILLDRIAKKENLSVNDEEVDTHLKKIAKQTGQPIARVKSNYAEPEKIEQLRDTILREKNLDFLLESAKIIPATAPAEQA